MMAMKGAHTSVESVGDAALFSVGSLVDDAMRDEMIKIMMCLDVDKSETLPVVNPVSLSAAQVTWHDLRLKVGSSLVSGGWKDPRVPESDGRFGVASGE